MAKRDYNRPDTYDYGNDTASDVSEAPVEAKRSRRRGKKSSDALKALQTSPAFDTSSVQAMRDSLPGLQSGAQSSDMMLPPPIQQDSTPMSGTMEAKLHLSNPDLYDRFRNAIMGTESPTSPAHNAAQTGSVILPGQFGGGIPGSEAGESSLMRALRTSLQRGGSEQQPLVAPDVPDINPSMMPPASSGTDSFTIPNSNTLHDAFGGDTSVDANPFGRANPVRNSRIAPSDSPTEFAASLGDSNAGSEEIPQGLPPAKVSPRFDTPVDGAPMTPQSGPGGTQVRPGDVEQTMARPNNLPGGMAGSYKAPPKLMSEGYDASPGSFNIPASQLGGMSNDAMYDGLGLQLKGGESTGAGMRPRPLDPLTSADLMMPDLGKSIPDLGSVGVGGEGVEMGLPPVQPRPTLAQDPSLELPQANQGENPMQLGSEQYGVPQAPPTASEANRLGDNQLHSLLRGYGKYRVAKAGIGLGIGAGAAAHHYLSRNKRSH